MFYNNSGDNMFCPNCGKEISEDKVFCNYCGRRILKNPINNQVSLSPLIDNNSNNYNSDNNIDFLKDYLGAKYDSFINGGFSFCAFFFGYFYFFYRKMYLFGLVVLAISQLITFFFQNQPILFSFVYIIFDVVLGFMFKVSYINYLKANESYLKGKKSTSLLGAILMSIIVFSIFGFVKNLF